MKFKDYFSKYGAAVVAIAIFLALGYIYCSPILKGRVLFAGDQQNFIGAVHESNVYAEQTGDHTFWTGSMFSGMPNYQIGGHLYTSTRLLAPIDAFISRPDNPAWIIFLYFFCFFICLRCFDVDKWLSIPGAIAIGLSSYFLVIIGAGHLTKTMTIAATAVVLGAFNLIFSKKKYILGAILTMVFVAAGATRHPQMFYYYFMLIGLMWITQLVCHIREKDIRGLILGTVVFAISVGLGLGANCANVFANAEYTEQTMRGGHSDLVSEEAPQGGSKGLDLEYATQWSYGIDETLSFLIPGAMGGASTMDVGTDSRLYKTLTENGVSPSSARDFCKSAPMYWGDQPFTAGNVYMGAIICFLFLLGCIVVKGPEKWGFLIGTVFSVFLAWGSNFMGLTKLFFNIFPLYNKFRAVSSILIVAEVAMPLLGFAALRDIASGKVGKKELEKGILWSAGITGGICLVLALIGGGLFSFTSAYDASWSSSVPDWVYAAICDQRAALLRADAFRSFIFIAAAAVSVLLYAAGKLKTGLFATILGLLVLFDMWPVDKRYFNDSSFVTPSQNASSFEMYPYEQAILQDQDPHFRVLNLTTNTYNESRTSFFLESIGGYSAAKLRRYQDLIDEHLSKLHPAVINMLNAKYIIMPGEDGQPQPRMNPEAMGNAWFVGELKVVDSAREESDALNVIDLRQTAVLDRSFAASAGNLNPGIAPDASVKLTGYTPKSLDYEYSSSQPGTIVFSEIYYPYGWKASIDGQSADHFRVNYTLRAMNVPAGKHSINFTFDPDSVHKGNTIAYICIILMYLATICGAAYGIWKTVKKES